MNLQKAKRTNVKIKLALQGPSGSGKTYSALQVAYGLCGNWDKIAVIDTENHSSELYAHLGAFNVLSLEEPFTPERYIDAITICETAGIEVIVVDSLSAEWSGKGGILDIHGNMAGNSFTNWSKLTPRHNDFVSAIIQSPCHIISSIRTKQDYVLTDKNGKMVPEKIGLASVQKEGIDYEHTVVFDLDIKHNATCSKDRTGLFMDKIPHVLTPDDGKKILQWCNFATDDLDIDSQILSEIEMCASVDELKNLYFKYPNHQQKLNSNFVNKKTNLQANSIDNTPSKYTSNGRANH